MSTPPPTRSEGEPHDRPTRLLNAALEAVKAHPEYTDEKLMLFLDSDEHGMGALVIDGYDDDAEAIANLFMHMRAIFRTQGKDMKLIEIGRG